MRKILLLFIILGSLVSSKPRAQEKIPDFGKIDMADMQLKECPFDKSADAMYLIKTENVKFSVDVYSGDSRITTEYRIRIKIFNERGFSNATVSIPYIGNSRITKITDLEGVIYNIDNEGKIETYKLDKEQIFNEKSKGRKSHNSIRFTFPDLKRGSVIEYRYTKINKNAYYIKPWVLQEEMPSRFTKCSITYPSKLVEVKYHFVASQPIVKDSAEKEFPNKFFNESTRSFSMADVPSFRQEPLMTSIEDNLQRIEFDIDEKGIFIYDDDSRWESYARGLMKAPYFGLQFTQPLPGWDALLDSINAIKDTSGKINFAYQYIKRTINWNDEQTFFSADLAQCLKDRSGSSAEMNILLLNLLRKAKIPCYAILISTVENGKIDRSFPTTSQFNGVDILAFSGDTALVLDCTQKGLSYKTTPFNVLNTDGYLVDNNFRKWVHIEDKRNLMNTELYVNAIVDSTGMLRGAGRIIFTGIAKAVAMTDEEKEKKKTDSKELIDEDSPDLKIDSSSEIHADDDNDTLVHIMQFHSTLSNTENLYFLNPFMFSLFKKDPFKDSVRYTDIDFGCNQSYATRILVLVPANFTIEDLPRSVAIRSEDNSIVFKREFLAQNNQLLIRHSFTFNRPLFTKDEYAGLKTFFDKVYASINEQIVLKKKED